MVFVNPAVERMIGWPPVYMVGSRLHEIVQHTKSDGTAL